MVCPNCGKQLNENEKFCDNCGTNITNNQSINQDIQLETNQLTNENLQSMNSQPVNQNKKNNTGLIIIIIILMIVLGVLVYFFVIKKDDNKTNDSNNNQTGNTTTTTTTVPTTTNNVTETTTVNQENDDTNNQNIVTEKGNYKLESQYQKLANQLKTKNSTSVDLPNVTFKINSNKEVEAIFENGDKSKIDIGNEKAKKIVGIALSYGTTNPTDAYVLTNNGNIYFISNNGQSTKVENNTNYAIDDIAVSNISGCNFNFKILKGKGGCIPAQNLIGITKNKEYIMNKNVSTLTYAFGNQDSFLINRIISNNDKVETENYSTLGYLYIYSDGGLNYINAKEHEKLNDEFNYLTTRRNIVDQNGNKIEARFVMNVNENYLIVDFNDNIYSLTNTSNNLTTVPYKNIKVTKIEKVKEREDSMEPIKLIETVNITYADNTTETLNGKGIIIYE